MKTNMVYLLLVLLLAEKTIQHVVVTLAFYFNWLDIASTVAVSPFVLMILGAIVAVLFSFCLWGMIAKRRWAPGLAIGLAVFDMVGEFVAQGRLDIVITISFITATLLLVLALTFSRRLFSLRTGSL